VRFGNPEILMMSEYVLIVNPQGGTHLRKKKEIMKYLPVIKEKQYKDPPVIPGDWEYNKSIVKVRSLIIAKGELCREFQNILHIGKNRALRILNEEREIENNG